MKVREVAGAIEEFATLGLQESYDNSGLNVGSPDAEVSGVLICVDVTDEVVDEALAVGANLGASLIEAAAGAKADVYLSADFKYNDFFGPDGRLVVADVGHFESEYCAIDLLYDIITKKIANFAVRKSERSVNPINYLV